MAVDDPNIQLVVGIGNSNSELDGLERRLNAVVTQLNAILPTLNVLGVDGVRNFAALRDQAQALGTAIKVNTFQGEYLKGLKETASSARAATQALKELQLQEGRDPKSINNAARSSDPDRVTTALAGNKRNANEAQLQLRQLEALAGQLTKAEQKLVDRETKRLENELTQAKKREARLISQLANIREREAIQNGIDRQVTAARRNPQIQAGFNQTAAGQARLAAEREADQYRIDRAAAEDENRRRTRAQNQGRAYQVSDATTVDRQRNQARAYEVSDATALDRQISNTPVNRARRQLSALQTQAEVTQNLLNDPDYIAVKQELKQLQTQLRAQLNPQTGQSVREEALANVQRKDRAAAVAEEEINIRKQTNTLPGAKPTRTVQEVTSDARARRQEYLTGDGGAFLFETQARLQAQYIGLDALFRGATEGVRAVLEFDKAMKNLQAVTGTTDAQLVGLSKTILDISRDSVFSAHDLAGVAEEMAKNGLTLAEIQTTLKNASVLASATGTSLKESTEVLTSTLETFKVQNSEAKIALDQTFFTLNSSRLSVDKLNESLQGAGVTAKESGLSFAEFSAGLATLANAGLSSTVQLNQGYRQVLTVLNEPTAKFKAKLDELGVSLKDIDPKVNSLVGVFENLKAAGFTTADAFSTLQARVATTFVAFLNNTEAYKAQYAATLNATGAAEAQSKALESLEDQVRRLGNTFTALAVNSTGPVKTALTSLVQGVNSVATGATSLSSTWTVMSTILAGLAVASASKGLFNLVSNLQAVQSATGAVRTVWQAGAASLGLLTVAEEGAAVATVTLGAALKGLAFSLGPGLAIAAAIGGIAYLASRTDEAADAAEKLKGRESELKDALEEKRKTLEKVNEFLDNTVSRSARLQTNQEELARAVDEARNQFGALNNGLNTNIATFDQLIGKLVAFRAELRGATGVELANFIQNTAAQASAADAAVRTKTGETGTYSLARELGIVKSGNFPGADGPVDLPFDTGTEARSAIDARFKTNPVGQEIVKTLLNVNTNSQDIAAALRSLRDGKAAFDPRDAAVLEKRLNSLAGDLSTRTTKTAEEGNLRDRERVNTFSIRPEVTSTVAPALARLDALIGDGKGLDNVRGATARGAASESLQQTADTQIKAIDEVLKGYSKDQLDIFNRTDEGIKFNTLKAKLREVVTGAGAYVEGQVVKTAEELDKSLKAEFQVQDRLITETKDPKVRRAAADAARKLAENIRINETKLLDAQIATDKKTGTDGLDLIDGRQNFGRSQIDAEYQSRINQINASQKRQDDKKGPKDPTRPNAQVLPDFVRELTTQETIIDRTASKDLAAADRPLKAQKAGLDAANQTGVIPQAVIELQRKQLNNLEINKEIAAAGVYIKQLAGLQDLQQKASDDLIQATLAKQQILAEYNLSIDEAGNIDFSKFKGTEARRTEIEKSLRNYLKQIDGLAGIDGQGGLIDKLRVSSETVQGKLDTSNALKTARDQKDQGFSLEQAGQGLQAVSAGFNKEHGLDDSVYKTYADSLTSTFDKMDKSFGSFIYNFTTGAAKGKNAFKDFVTSLISDAAKIASQKAASAILGEIISLGANALGALTAPTTLPAGGGGDPNLMYQGGIVVPKYDQGGIIPGVHIGRDSVPILAAPGEALLNRSAVSLIGSDAINAMNAGALRRSQSMPSLPPPKQPDMVNVYVVDKNTTPQLGKKDVLAAVGEDILAGGATKKLIQQVAVGNV